MVNVQNVISVMTISPFDYLNTINSTKKDIMVDDIAEKDYNAFLINRSLSYFNDTVLIANEMNIYSHLDKRLQYDFLLNMVRKRKRFSKWIKPDQLSNIEIVKLAYDYSDEKARQVIDLLSDEQLEALKRKYSKGGKKP